MEIFGRLMFILPVVFIVTGIYFYSVQAKKYKRIGRELILTGILTSILTLFSAILYKNYGSHVVFATIIAFYTFYLIVFIQLIRWIHQYKLIKG